MIGWSGRNHPENFGSLKKWWLDSFPTDFGLLHFILILVILDEKIIPPKKTPINLGWWVKLVNVPSNLEPVTGWWLSYAQSIPKGFDL